jgi:dTDP-4-amino-4,6-dideoxygalactose transaminase
MAFSTEGIPNPWYYEMDRPGFNYRLTDIQAALGMSQLNRLQDSLRRRIEIADCYQSLIKQEFTDNQVIPLSVRSKVTHAYHLFVVRIDFDRLGVSRAVVMNRLRANGIGTQVHYIPVHLQPYYRRINPTDPRELPGMETYYDITMTLPMYPEMTNDDVQRIVKELARALDGQTTADTVDNKVKQDHTV